MILHKMGDNIYNKLFVFFDALAIVPIVIFMLFPSALCYHIFKYPRELLDFLKIAQPIFFINAVPFVVGLIWFVGRHNKAIDQKMPNFLKGRWLAVILGISWLGPIIALKTLQE